MLIHRPFIPGVSSMVQSVSLTSFYFIACGHGSFDVSRLQDPQALGICAAAARACILVADTHRRRPNNPLLFSQVHIQMHFLLLAAHDRAEPRLYGGHDTDNE
jgi:hypothetical protein